MKRIMMFGFESLDDFVESVRTDVDITYTNANRDTYNFHLEPGGYGYEIYHYESDKVYDYHSIEEMLNNHIMPDGVPLIDVWNGENYQFEEECQNDIQKRQEKA